MNLPNKLSVFRIILIPLILFFMLPISVFGLRPVHWNDFVNNYGLLVSGTLFVIAALTDLADGMIARKYKMITNLGKFLDSLADKMLVISVLVGFVERDRISSFLVVIIVLREFMVTGLRLVASKSGLIMAAEMIGKIKTVTQMIAIIFLFFESLFVFWTGLIFPSLSVESIEAGVRLCGNIFVAVSIVMTIISGLDYLIRNRSFLKETKE
ncbi:MAG: CDP-diacylglycerol--glycerol-3-phosphate 3-phosphatidyltransferase [Clostridiaceae bacterium]|nr:CDP-diacylglycerol--glycerol-3-phosphate 3-phosphatidyltransferase [Clostridiaceae bacterium]